MAQFRITTFDNDVNPWLDYEQWLTNDRLLGWNTNEKLASLLAVSTEISEIEENEAYDNAINDLCDLLPGIYLRVYKP